MGLSLGRFPVSVLGGGRVLAALVLDADAANYISRVETADGQPLEPAIKAAMNSLFLALKSGTITLLQAIKAACLMCGPRTLAGARVPLLPSMPAPTNFGFVAGDYNRLRLKGNGIDKYLSSNLASNALPQDNFHMAARLTDPNTTDTAIMGADTAVNGASHIFSNPSGNRMIFRVRTQINLDVPGKATAINFVGTSRTSPTAVMARIDGINTTFSSASTAPSANNLLVFSREGTTFSNAGLANYSFGEALDLAAYDAALANYYNAVAAALA